MTWTVCLHYYAAYSKKCRSSEKTLMDLAWKVKELSDLNECGRELLRRLLSLADLLDNQQQYTWERENVPRRLVAIRDNFSTLVKRVTCHKQTAATHLLVFMCTRAHRALLCSSILVCLQVEMQPTV